MPFDFDSLAALRNDPVAFEAARKALIEEAMSKMPSEQRVKCEAYQREIDHLRTTMPHDAFLAELFRRMQENLADISDYAVNLQHALENESELPNDIQAVKNKIAFASKGFTFPNT